MIGQLMNIEMENTDKKVFMNRSYVFHGCCYNHVTSCHPELGSIDPLEPPLE